MNTLEKIDVAISEAFEKARVVQAQYTDYSNQTKGKIKDILVEKGIWDLVHTLEMSLIERQKSSEKALEDIQKDLDQLGSLKKFVEDFDAKHPKETPVYKEILQNVNLKKTLIKKVDK